MRSGTGQAEPFACKACGSACPASWSHCGACGAPLRVRCGRCRRAVPALAFCVRCGSLLPGGSVPDGQTGRPGYVFEMASPVVSAGARLVAWYARLPAGFRGYGGPIGVLAVGALAALELSTRAYHAGFLLSLLAGALLILILQGGPPIEESVETTDGVVRGRVQKFILFGALALATVTDVLAFHEASGLAPAGFWLASVVLVVFAFRDPDGPGFQRHDWLLAALLFLVALPSRTLFLATLPPGIHGDEADWALLALRLWRGEGPAFAYLWLGYPGTSFIPYALTLGVLGSTISAARLASGILAALLLLLNVYNFQFSRMGLPNIEAVPLAIYGATALLAAGAGAGRWRQWSIFGVTVGLSMMVYLTALAWPLVAGVVLFPSMVQKLRHGSARPLFIGLGVALVAALITASPLMVYVARHPATLGARASSLTIWSPDGRIHSSGSFGLRPDDEVGILRVQLQRTLESLQSRGDSSLQLGETQPSLDPVAAVGLVLGLAGFVVVWRRPSARLATSWLGLSLFLGGVILIDPPFAPRLVLVIPAACLIAGFGLAQAWGLVLSRLTSSGRWTLPAAITSIAIGAAIAFSHYSGPYWQNYPNQRITALARYVRSVQDQRSVVFLGLDEPTDYVTLRFMAPRAHILRWNLDRPSPPPRERAALAILTPANGPDAATAARLIDARYPRRREFFLQNAAGRRIVHVWLVD